MCNTHTHACMCACTNTQCTHTLTILLLLFLQVQHRIEKHFGGGGVLREHIPEETVSVGCIYLIYFPFTIFQLKREKVVQTKVTKVRGDKTRGDATRTRREDEWQQGGGVVVAHRRQHLHHLQLSH